MTVLHPCLRCHRRVTCEIKKKTSLLLRGSGITKASIRCAIPEQDFPPGCVVNVSAFQIEAGHYDYEKSAITCRGVISQWRKRLATVVLEKANEITTPSGPAIGYLHVPSDRLTRIANEPLRELCKCGLDQQRCEDNIYPTIRNGQWQCWSEMREQERDQSAAALFTW